MLKTKRYLCISSSFGLPLEKQKLQLLSDGDVCSCLLDERLLQDGASLSDCVGWSKPIVSLWQDWKEKFQAGSCAPTSVVLKMEKRSCFCVGV